MTRTSCIASSVESWLAAEHGLHAGPVLGRQLPVRVPGGGSDHPGDEDLGTLRQHRARLALGEQPRFGTQSQAEHAVDRAPEERCGLDGRPARSHPRARGSSLDHDLICLVPHVTAAHLMGRGVPLRSHEVPFDLLTAEVELRWHRRVHDDPASRWLCARLRDVVAGLAATPNG